ncbi:hypothetical protein [Streptomyces sp. NBC_00872]|uniref:hypothetical protein n=1 Tax=Streptomyces sp. NBC_00872 TaxID=2903686 RepID=UPI00387029D9|nr:hypothetical protein OG214_00325 [Streptomyces sp. NBC_00872]
MTKTVRWVKGTLVSGPAAVVCYWMWTSLREWADNTSDGDAMGSGLLEGLLASVVGLLTMPLLLWAGMRLLGEKGNHLLVLLGVVAWWLIGAHVVEDAVGAGATALYVSLFAVLGGLLAGVQPRVE